MANEAPKSLLRYSLYQFFKLAHHLNESSIIKGIVGLYVVALNTAEAKPINPAEQSLGRFSAYQNESGLVCGIPSVYESPRTVPEPSTSNNNNPDNDNFIVGIIAGSFGYNPNINNYLRHPDNGKLNRNPGITPFSISHDIDNPCYGDLFGCDFSQKAQNLPIGDYFQGITAYGDFTIKNEQKKLRLWQEQTRKNTVLDDHSPETQKEGTAILGRLVKVKTPNAKFLLLATGNLSKKQKSTAISNAISYAQYKGAKFLVLHDALFSKDNSLYNKQIKKAISDFSGLIIVPAGDEEINLDDYHAEDIERHPNLLVVAEQTPYPVLCKESNYGSKVEFAIRAKELSEKPCTSNKFKYQLLSIFSERFSCQSDFKNYDYYNQGTPAAAAETARVVTQMLNVNPTLENEDIKQILMETSDPLPYKEIMKRYDLKEPIDRDAGTVAINEERAVERAKTYKKQEITSCRM